MDYMNWGWPQYLLAFWWIAGPIIALFIMACGAKGNYKKFAFRQFNVIVLAWILYMGGFWS